MERRGKGRLSEDIQKEVVRLRKQGKSYQVIADMTDISPTSVRRIVWDAATRASEERPTTRAEWEHSIGRRWEAACEPIRKRIKLEKKLKEKEEAKKCETQS